MPMDIQPIFGAINGRWKDIPTTCHMATLYWIHQAELRKFETQNEYLNAFESPTKIMNDMLAYGRRLTKPVAGNINLTPGSVIIFAMNGIALHSCVAINPNSLAGYNQVNWFKSVGVSHEYSTHNVADIKWIGIMNNQVEGNTPRSSPCELIVVQEDAAKAYIRQMVQ